MRHKSFDELIAPFRFALSDSNQPKVERRLLEIFSMSLAIPFVVLFITPPELDRHDLFFRISTFTGRVSLLVALLSLLLLAPVVVGRRQGKHSFAARVLHFYGRLFLVLFLPGLVMALILFAIFSWTGAF